MPKLPTRNRAKPPELQKTNSQQELEARRSTEHGDIAKVTQSKGTLESQQSVRHNNNASQVTLASSTIAPPKVEITTARLADLRVPHDKAQGEFILGDTHRLNALSPLNKALKKSIYARMPVIFAQPTDSDNNSVQLGLDEETLSNSTTPNQNIARLIEEGGTASYLLY